jgi:hypothetical protein
MSNLMNGMRWACIVSSYKQKTSDDKAAIRISWLRATAHPSRQTDETDRPEILFSVFHFPPSFATQPICSCARVRACVRSCATRVIYHLCVVVIAEAESHYGITLVSYLNNTRWLCGGLRWQVRSGLRKLTMRAVGRKGACPIHFHSAQSWLPSTG